MMFDSLIALFRVFTREEKAQFIILQILVTVSALFELGSVALIGPFMTLVGDPGYIASKPLLQQAYSAVHASSPQEFLAVVGALILIVTFVGTCLGVAAIWRLSRFAAAVGSALGDRLYRSYMGEMYSVHLTRNSATLINNIAIEVKRVTDNVLQPVAQINARLVLIIFVVTFLLIYEPMVTIVGGGMLIALYYGLYLFVRQRLSLNSEIITDASERRLRLMHEGFDCLKELDILDRKTSYIREFENCGARLAESYGISNGLYNAPRYIVEFMIYGSLIGVVLTMLARSGGNANDVLAVIAIFGVAALKLLPAAQQLYSGIAQIKGNLTSLRGVTKQLGINRDGAQARRLRAGWKPTGQIEARRIRYNYPGSTRPNLIDISLQIAEGSIIGIVGPTGSGKSTLLNVLCGLLKPTAGALFVGEKEINDGTVRDWMDAIGYVPQTPALVDATIAENIAIGSPANQIELARLRHVGEMADIIEWTDELPDGLWAQVGERGLQLSGGQRQRIAIARALYRESKYLFLDEATSALDGLTEAKIMNSIRMDRANRTIIIVAHRLNTVRLCDQIIVMKSGSFDAAGTYDELSSSNETFKSMLQGATESTP